MSLTKEQRDYLLKNSVFTDSQINHLLRVFKTVLGSNADVIARHELWRLYDIPECTANALIEAGGRLYCKGRSQTQIMSRVRHLGFC